jgi:hypothetical protein
MEVDADHTFDLTASSRKMKNCCAYLSGLRTCLERSLCDEAFPDVWSIASGRKRTARPTSSKAFLQIDTYNNDIGVPSFILSGASMTPERGNLI